MQSDAFGLYATQGESTRSALAAMLRITLRGRAHCLRSSKPSLSTRQLFSPTAIIGGRQRLPTSCGGDRLVLATRQVVDYRWPANSARAALTRMPAATGLRITGVSSNPTGKLSRL